ncbi:MAG: InlB B-repeat-containing protein [Firmicutes bacterium]|nr:InlB B-repeat-containing protein [Bacillota bacterium]
MPAYRQSPPPSYRSVPNRGAPRHNAPQPPKKGGALKVVIILLLLIVVLGVGGAFVYNSFFASKPQEPGKEPDTELPVTVEYTVTFDSMGGSKVDAIKVLEGDKIVAPRNPSKESFIFDGWYKEPQVSQAWNFAVDTVHTNLVLYAKWQEDIPGSFWVQFDTQGGSMIDSISVLEGQKITKPSDPILDGHSFAGWYKEQSTQNLWNFESDVVTQDTTLYAKWESVALTQYTVHFDTQGGTSVDDVLVLEGQKITKPSDPILDGHSFAGWYKEQSTQNLWNFESDVVTQDTTLYAKWESVALTQYTVHFDTQGGTSIDDVIVTDGQKVQEPNEPYLDEHYFDGWYKDSEGVTKWDFDQDIVTSDVTIYAVWIQSNPLLRYELNTEQTAYAIKGWDKGAVIVGDPYIVIPSMHAGLPVTSIAYQGFQNCTNLVEIKIPNTVTAIGMGAFFNCTSLRTIMIPNSVTAIGSLAEDYGVFQNCGSLEEIVIPDSVTVLGVATFSACSALKSIVIPDGVKDIGLQTFKGCRALESVVLPSGLKSLGTDAFAFCTVLTDIVLPSSVTALVDTVFSGCSGLVSIFIPKSVNKMGAQVFLGCSNLTINAEANSQPSDWDNSWNPDDRPVNWGFVGYTTMGVCCKF